MPIKIKSKKPGFRRCGIAHTVEAKEYPDGKFTPAELAALKAEPMLVVEEIKKVDYDEMPNKELEAILTEKGVVIPPKSTKADLLKLIKKNV
jgi:hypothetical protein